MIILTLREIFNAVPFLREISNKEFPSSTAFKIARLIRELDKEIELFEIERTKIIYKNCEKDHNGNPVLLENGNIKLLEHKIEDATTELNTLFKNQVEINAEKIPILAFNSIELTPEQAINLEAIVNFE
jgi:hypothetical protein